MALEVRILNTATGQIDFSFFAWMMTGKVVRVNMPSFLIQGSEKPILVDTGARDLEELVAHGTQGAEMPPELDLVKQLGSLGIKPEDVGYIILTHLHVDHPGQVTRFPKAKIVVQKRELAYAIAPVHPEGMAMGMGALTYDRQDLAALVGPLWHRLIIIDGDHQVVPGVRCVLMGGHSPGSQAVYVETTHGRVILAGDNCSCFANYENGAYPVGWYHNWDELVFAQRRMIAEGDIIVPSHDPDLMKRFPGGLVRGKPLKL